MPAQGGFKENGAYKFYGSEYDKLYLAACQVRIWFPNENRGAATVYTEVTSVEIQTSYKDPVSTATVILPRGSVMKVIKQDKEVVTGSGTSLNDEDSYLAHTDLVTDGTTKATDGKGIRNAAPTKADYGFVNTPDIKIVGENELGVGNRIEIQCGYVETEEDLERVRNGEDMVSGMQKLFTGTIIGCSATSPFKLECEGGLAVLKKITSKKQIVKRNLTIKELFGGDGLNLLAGSGLTVSERSLNSGIAVGTIDFMASTTVMEIVKKLNERGIMAWRNDEGEVEFGVNLYMNGVEETDPKSIAYGNSERTFIQFDWHVAQDNLSVTRVEKNYIAIRAKAQVDDSHVISVLARKGDKEEWIFQNVRDVKYKKYKKKAGGTTVYDRTQAKDSSLDGYTVVRFTSTTAKSMEELKKEAIAYWGKVNPNAMEGTVSVFGDCDVKVPSVVGLVDPRNPEKEGFYLVESVSVEFSVESGYRRNVKFSHKLGGFDDGAIYVADNVISV